MDGNFDDAFKKKLLETFRFTIDFLEKHNIRWYAAGGTAIGAVRHRGMIPWDDDVDIHIPREDYERLSEVSEELEGTKYEFVSLHTDSEYYLPSAKIMDKTTTVWESPVYGSSVGVYVDIFPMDQCDYDRTEYSRKLKAYSKHRTNMQLAFSRYSIAEAVRNIRERHFGCLYNGMRSILRPYAFRERYRQKFIDVEHMFDKKNGDFLVTPTGVYGVKEHYEKRWYDDYTMLPFEDFQVRLPKWYHEYLTMLYGDYVMLPSARKQVSHHARYYVNLKEHLDVEEIKLRMKSGEKYVY